MAIGVALARRLFEQKREAEDKLRFREEKERGDAFLQRFDTDQTGELSQDQLKNMMSYMNDGNEPTEEEVASLFQVANTRNMSTLDIAEVVDAASRWEYILQERNALDSIFKDFDIRDEGVLDSLQVNQCLSEITEKKPTAQFLDDMSKQFNINMNAVTKPHLRLLIENWCVYCNPKDFAAREVSQGKAENDRIKRANKIRNVNEKENNAKWIGQFSSKNDGFLTKPDLGKMMAAMNSEEEPTKAEVNHIFKESNIRYADNLNIQEATIATKIWGKIVEDRMFITNIFKKYDVNENGKLEFSEFKECLTELFDNVSDLNDEDIGKLILRINKDKSGAINIQELKPIIEDWFENYVPSEIERKKKSSACCVM